MFGRIARQRRRFAATVLISTLTVVLAIETGWVELEEGLHSGPLMLVSALLASMIILGAMTVAFALLVPSLLVLVEVLLLGSILFSALGWALGPFLDGAAGASWIWMVLCMGTYFVTFEVLYGASLSDLGRRDMAPYRFSLTLPAPPEAVWKTLVPQSPLAPEFLWPQASTLPAPQGSDADFILCLPRRKDIKDAVVEIRYDALIPFQFARYTETPRAGTTDPETLVEITIAPNPDGACTVTVMQQFRNVPFKKRLSLWLNHGYRDAEAFFKARLTGRRDWSLLGVQMLRG